MVKKICELHNLLALASLSRFTFWGFVELLEDLLLEPVAILAVLEGVEVCKNELVEQG